MNPGEKQIPADADPLIFPPAWPRSDPIVVAPFTSRLSLGMIEYTAKVL